MTCQICYTDLDSEFRANSFTCYSCSYNLCKVCKEQIAWKPCPNCKKRDTIQDYNVNLFNLLQEVKYTC